MSLSIGDREEEAADVRADSARFQAPEPRVSIIGQVLDHPAVGESLETKLSDMRILGFCDYFSDDSCGGIERVALEVYQRLARMGCRLSVLTALPGSMKPLTRLEGVALRTVRLYDMSRIVGAQVGVAPKLFREAARLADEFRPNVLYAHGIHFQASIAAARLQRSRRLPLVTVSHVASLENLKQPVRSLTTLYERTVGRYILSRSSRVIAISDSVSQHLLELGVNAESIRRIVNGVDLERFCPQAPNAPMNSPPLVMFVGRHISNKGPQILMDALVLLRKQGVRFAAVFLSDGPLRRGLERRASEGGLDGCIRFTGYVPDVATEIRRADIVVRPSLTEGMPLSVLEAMASHVCVLASDIPGNRDLIHNRENGVLVPAGNADQLARALRRLIEDSTLRRRLADAGYQTAQAYSWDACASATARVLSEARLEMAAKATRPRPPLSRDLAP